MHLLRSLSAIILVLLGLGLAACSTAEKVEGKRTVDEIFADAKKLYEENDWNEALAQFDIIKLQYPASQYADDAQYYVAEINRRRGEYVLAAFNYSSIRRSYPTSEWAKPSAFKVGECYEELALPADRDQEYTKKAINAYTDFQTIYPTDSLALVALQKIHVLRGRLAEGYMRVAEHYVTTNSRKSAVIYYDMLIKEYPDTEHYEDALVEKLKIHFAQAKIEDARAAISLYRRTVTNPTRKDEVDQMEKELP
jgi:outer membrane protein assembly factor BamD